MYNLIWIKYLERTDVFASQIDSTNSNSNNDDDIENCNRTFKHVSWNKEEVSYSCGQLASAALEKLLPTYSQWYSVRVHGSIWKKS